MTEFEQKEFLSILWNLQRIKAHNSKEINVLNFDTIIVKPWPQTLSPKTPKPKTKGPWADTKIPWATTPPITFKHDGGVQQKKSQVDSERKDIE